MYLLKARPKPDRIVKRLEDHRLDSRDDIAIALNNFDQPYAERRLAPSY